MDEFEIIRRERTFLRSLDEQSNGSSISEKTKTGYGIEYARLLKKSGGKKAAFLAEARNTRSSATWYRRRAAIIFTAKFGLAAALKEQDLLQRTLQNSSNSVCEKWTGKVWEVKSYGDLIREMQAQPALGLRDRKKRVSKKQSLAGLPDNWRQKLASRLPKYRLPFLVAAASGCRPDELHNGVRLSTKDGKIRIFIHGSKVTATSGQPDRTVLLVIDKTHGSISRQLYEAIESGVDEVKIDSAKLFSGAIRDAARREWKSKKIDLSAYSLRHQFSADLKGAEFSAEQIAVLLGHVTTKTASYYGDRRQARGGIEVVVDISSCHPVRQIRVLDRLIRQKIQSPTKIIEKSLKKLRICL